MQIISTAHLAQILIGIARAQAAIVQAGKGEAAIEALTGLRDGAQSLENLPVRILVASLGRTRPDAAAVAQELERLCAGPAQPPSPMDQRPTDFNP
jgi:hypothetical protein